MFAVKAGDVRLSVFQSQEAVTPSTAVQIVLRTNSLEAERDRLVSAGIELENDIVEAPGFMRFFTVADPSGHILHIAQYFGDPLHPAQS
jgi:predicted enzyme related to lactoylglutathione lyase